MLNVVFLTTSLSTTLTNFFKSIGKVFKTSKLSTFAFKLIKLVGTLTNLLMSSLLNSNFKLMNLFKQLN